MIFQLKGVVNQQKMFEYLDAALGMRQMQKEKPLFGQLDKSHPYILLQPTLEILTK